MATKADIFVEEATDELSAIRRRIEQVALDCQVLANRWQALGKTNMEGWAGYGFVRFTAAELAQALNGLTQVVDTADGVTLANMHTQAKALDKIVKAGL